MRIRNRSEKSGSIAGKYGFMVEKVVNIVSVMTVPNARDLF